MNRHATQQNESGETRGIRIRVLIADDEKLARQGIRMLLEEDPEIGAIEEADNGEQAATLMSSGAFDLVFLDVRMPTRNGFAALRSARPGYSGAVIFVTAYNQYAIDAFEVNAVDYLLKPFKPRRFHEALRRAKDRVRSGMAPDARILAALDRIAAGAPSLDRIAVRTPEGTILVPVEELDWLKAAENYVELHVGQRSYLVEGALSEIARRLDPSRFVRIHRSTVVNVTRIRAIQPASHSEYLVTLAGGVQLRSGRTYKDTLQSLISNPF